MASCRGECVGRDDLKLRVKSLEKAVVLLRDVLIRADDESCEGLNLEAFSFVQARMSEVKKLLGSGASDAEVLTAITQMEVALDAMDYRLPPGTA